MQQHKYHVKSRHILGDLLTPVSTYLKVRDLYPQSALMESSDYHGNDNSRSFIALNPMASIEIGHGRAKASFPDGTNTEQNIDDTCRTEDVLNCDSRPAEASWPKAMKNMNSRKSTTSSAHCARPSNRPERFPN